MKIKSTGLYTDRMNDSLPLEVKGITIHNTGTTESASELRDKMKKSGQLYLCHYIVDEENIVQTTDESVCAYDTGKGYDFGNRFTIAVEICRSQSDFSLYLRAQRNAVKFIKTLLDKYNLTTKDIYFHNDFNTRTYCPHKILDYYGNKKNFIEKEF